MAELNEIAKYDETLTSILVNEQSILGFLSAIFNFLARRTDFYYVPDGPYENMGFPAGVAEELVVKVLRNCDPKNWTEEQKPVDINDDIMCSTVAQEVEVENETEDTEEEQNEVEKLNVNIQNKCTISELAEPISDHNYTMKPQEESKSFIPDDYKPPVIPVQKNSEAYNGAVRDKYTWSQTITELDIIVNLPLEIKSAKDLRVNINPLDITVASRTGNIILKDSLPFKIKTLDSFWCISEGRLLIHLEKTQERWWTNFLSSEEPLDVSKMDCSRPLDELPDDHIAKVRELQWNQEQKMKGLPTSDDIRQIEILKKAWNAPGSPFQGKEFDPNVLHRQ